MNDGKPLTRKEFADYIGSSVRHVDRLRAAKKVVAFRIGTQRGVRFDRGDVRRFVESSKAAVAAGK